MNDLIIKTFVECDGVKSEEQETDTHWRAMGAKGEWNWRMKYKLELPSKNIRLTFQAWDRNLYKWNTALATATLDLARLAFSAQDEVGSTGYGFEKPHQFDADIHGPIPPLHQGIAAIEDECAKNCNKCLSQILNPGPGDDENESGAFWLPLNFIENQTVSDGGLKVNHKHQNPNLNPNSHAHSKRSLSH